MADVDQWYRALKSRTKSSDQEIQHMAVIRNAMAGNVCIGTSNLAITSIFKTTGKYICRTTWRGCTDIYSQTSV